MTELERPPKILYDIHDLCAEYLTEEPTRLQWSNTVGALTANLCAYIESIEDLNAAFVLGTALHIKQQINDCVDRMTQGVH